jgi:ABC-type polysaccharide/polyol phosphate transport system ATPase subunit
MSSKKFMSDTVVSVENLSKRYLIGHQAAQRERYTTLREAIGREGRNFVRKASDLFHGRQIVQGDELEEFWALRDVTFDVKRGEVVGIIGSNGAGKSTLLKIVSRIVQPSNGRVRLRGRVASLLEVGTGFHPELSGRENVFLNGAIMGMTRRDIRKKFDEIVAFAEVERFVDTPVKRYSSGMYVRLAFAVAAHLEPEILIVDEVLAVGDLGFQKKCLGKMSEVAQSHRTVLFVSHNISAVEQLCSKALLLDEGKVKMKGEVREVVSAYSSSSSKHVIPQYPPYSDPKGGIEIIRIALCDGHGNPLKVVTAADSLNLRIELIVHVRRRDLKLAFNLWDTRHNPIFTGCPIDDGVDNPTQPGHHEFQVALPPGLFMAQRYYLTVSAYSALAGELYNRSHALLFDVLPAASHPYSMDTRIGVIQVPSKWMHRMLSHAEGRQGASVAS